MKPLYWVGLVLLIFGTASFFVGLPSPFEVSPHTLTITLREALFLVGMGFIVAGLTWDPGIE